MIVLLYFIIAWNYHLVLISFGHLSNSAIFIRWYILSSAESAIWCSGIVGSAWIRTWSPLLLLLLKLRLIMTAILAWAHLLIRNLALLWSCILINSTTTFLLNTPWIQLLIGLSILLIGSNLPRLSTSMLRITFISMRTTSNFALLVWWNLLSALLVICWRTSWLRSSRTAFLTALVFWLRCAVWAVLGIPLVRIVVWIMQHYIWRKTLDYPFVLETFIWRQSFLWIPF